MSTRPINLDTYSLSLLTAKEDIINPRSSINWALFVYDGISNKLRLADSGAGGVDELASKFHMSKPQYGLCRTGHAQSGTPKTAMIIWTGQDVDDYRRTECASHIPAIKNFFKEVHVFVKAERPEEVTEERIKAELSKAHSSASTQWLRRSSQSSMDRKDVVGTNYRKTNAAMEMRLANRDSFWARAEREEEERKEEERKRAAEERRRLERERALKEKQDAEERDRKMNEKLKTIEEQRRIAAEQEEQEHRKEKLRWERQQREHEEEMRARLKRSESIEKAAEAAALVSQRTMNPREFFRQLSSSSSQSPTSPSRAGKPFRRYQRSLTDTAFIFSKAEESAASSPRTSPLVSPFSRAPHSPFTRAASPPTSPTFLPSTSPQRTPASPPLSPLRPAPPSSALPSVSLPNIQVRGRARSPSEPVAPPASPTSLTAAGPASVEEGSAAIVTERSAFSFEPNASPPDQPVSAAELASEISYKVQTVLIEEDEEEEENVKEKEDSQPKTEPQSEPEGPAEDGTRTRPEQEETGQKEAVEEVKGQRQHLTEPEATEGRLEDDTEGTQITEETQAIEDMKKMQTTEDIKKTQPTEDIKKTHTTEDIKKTQPTEDIKKTQTTEDIKKTQTTEDIKKTQPTEDIKKTQTTEDIKKTQTTEDIKKTQTTEDTEETQTTEDLEKQEEDEEAITEEVPGQSEHDLDDTEVTDPIVSEESLEIITNGNSQEHNGTDHSLSPSDAELDSPELAVYCRVQDDEEEDDICLQKYITFSENGEEVLTEPQLCVRALYDYQAEDESELSFELGDIIRDVETVDKGWWRGWSQDGRQGLFPANYVETVSPQ